MLPMMSSDLYVSLYNWTTKNVCKSLLVQRNLYSELKHLLQHLHSQLTPILKNMLHVDNDNYEGSSGGQKGNAVPVCVMIMYGGVRV
jgi:hypothetical protein